MFSLLGIKFYAIFKHIIEVVVEIRAAVCNCCAEKMVCGRLKWLLRVVLIFEDQNLIIHGPFQY